MTASPGYANQQNYPPLKQTTDRVWLQNSYGEAAVQLDYSGSNLSFVGIAAPGADTSAAVWQIKQLTYNGSNQLISITWPHNSFGQASSDYSFAWSLRGSYTYS